MFLQTANLSLFLPQEAAGSHLILVQIFDESFSQREAWPLPLLVNSIVVPSCRQEVKL